jgi:hypothetical protein
MGKCISKTQILLESAEELNKKIRTFLEKRGKSVAGG